MYEYFAELLSSDGFMPRWDCGRWTPFHGWLYIVSDIGVWAAYTAIPAVLIYFAWRKSTIPFKAVFLLFGTFIMACGLTHLLDAIMFWWPGYRLLGLVELITAVVSWGTVVALVPIVPRALAMRSPEELQREIDARRKAEIELHEANEELERRIRERTAELQATNDALRQERKWFETTLISIGDAVIATDTQGHVTLVNGVAEKLTGWTEQEAKRQPLETVFQIFNEQTRQPAENPALRALREGTIVGLANHTILVQKNGREMPIDDSAAPIRDDNGEVLGVVLVFRDVTERRQAVQALHDSAEQLRVADRRKDEFLAILAHELRNPLAPIRTAIELMKIEKDPQTIAWAQQVMQRQVEHIVRLVDDLLDVSRIMQGKIQLKREPVALAPVVEHALDEVRADLKVQQQQFSLSLPNEPVWLNADPIRLSQIISNLLSNAVKYTDPGGQIALRAEVNHDQLTLRVKDTGIGIPPEMLDQVFVPFTQLTHSLDRARGGLGIGLALVRNLVAMHEGSVTAGSEGAGKGSEFVIRLPILREHVGQEPVKWQAAPVTAKRVLVVDDNDEAAQSLRLLLSKLWNHTVEVANDGPAALERFAQFRPEVVLLDIGLPGMDGYETAQRIRDLPGGREVLLAALTGYGQVDDRRKSREAGFDVHLVKPASADALQQLFNHPKLAAK